MELTINEKETLKFLVEEKLKKFKGEEIKRDVPLKFLEAEKEYEDLLKKLLEKFKN
jgi:hypothetical protein